VLQNILKISALLLHALCYFQRVLCNFEQSRLIYFTNVSSMFCFCSSGGWWLFPVFFSAWRKRRQMRKVNLALQTTWCNAVWAVRLPRDFFIFMKLINIMTVLVTTGLATMSLNHSLMYWGIKYVSNVMFRYRFYSSRHLYIEWDFVRKDYPERYSN